MKIYEQNGKGNIKEVEIESEAGNRYPGRILVGGSVWGNNPPVVGESIVVTLPPGAIPNSGNTYFFKRGEHDEFEQALRNHGLT